MSVVCGPCQLPQQRWKRILSDGSPLIEWLSASRQSFRVAPVALDVWLFLRLIPALAYRRIVKLEGEPGVDDRLVFHAHRIRAGVHQLFFGLVVFAGEARAACRRDRVHPAVLHAGSFECVLEVGDIALNRRLALVFDRAGDHGAIMRHELLGQVAPGLRIAVGLCKLVEIPAIAPIAEHKIVGREPF